MAHISLVLAAALIAPIAFADEVETQPKSRRVTMKHLLNRIEKLERQVAELEGERQAEVPTRYVPLPPRALRPDTGRPLTLQDTVPDSWGRFQFNGQWFFIVPIGEDGIRATAGHAATPERSGHNATAHDPTLLVAPSLDTPPDGRSPLSERPPADGKPREVGRVFESP